MAISFNNLLQRLALGLVLGQSRQEILRLFLGPLAADRGGLSIPKWPILRGDGVARPARIIGSLMLACTLAASPAWAVESGPADTVAAPWAAGRDGLLRALADYQAVAKGEPWPVVPVGSTLRRGDNGPGVAALSARLAREGLMPANGGPAGSDDPAVFGKDMEAALRAFQRRHGLAEDGVAGGRTLAALNVPAAMRVVQIQRSLERLDALPASLGETHIVINIADQRLQMVAAGEIVFSSRLVVGKPATPTPVLASALRTVIFNPTWSIPPSIAVGEILPKLRRDPTYLERERIIIRERGDDPHGLGIDWHQTRLAPFGGRLLQLPGDDNALGRIKFDFPNPHQVYLHDTPARQLFDRPSRAFSHGCLRLQNPQRLAELLLEAQGWSADRLGAAIAARKTQAIALTAPVLLWVVYLTAFPDSSGAIHFRDDIYGLDR